MGRRSKRGAKGLVIQFSLSLMLKPNRNLAKQPRKIKQMILMANLEQLTSRRMKQNQKQARNVLLLTRQVQVLAPKLTGERLRVRMSHRVRAVPARRIAKWILLPRVQRKVKYQGEVQRQLGEGKPILMWIFQRFRFAPWCPTGVGERLR